MWLRCHESKQPHPSLARFQAARSAKSRRGQSAARFCLRNPVGAAARQSAQRGAPLGARGIATRSFGTSVPERSEPPIIKLASLVLIEAGFGDWIGKSGKSAFCRDRRENHWRGDHAQTTSQPRCAVRPQFIAHCSSDPDARQQQTFLDQPLADHFDHRRVLVAVVAAEPISRVNRSGARR
jgi:hypothetical protein